MMSCQNSDNKRCHRPIVTYFTAAQATRLRNRIRRKIKVPSNPPDGWSRVPYNPEALINSLPGISLKPEYTLKAYLYRAGLNGNGLIRAEKKGMNIELPEWNNYPGTSYPYKQQPGTERHIVEALMLDGTAKSYITASLLERECLEYGALWHGLNWSTHEIIDSRSLNGETEKNQGEWVLEAPWAAELTWDKQKPGSFTPSVTKEINKITVKFYSYSEMGEQAIYRHIDEYTYKKGGFKTTTEVIARGAGGFLF